MSEEFISKVFSIFPTPKMQKFSRSKPTIAVTFSKDQRTDRFLQAFLKM